MKNSKRKGKVAELELAHLFTDLGLPARRSQQFCGREGHADITFLDKYVNDLLFVECKREERLNLDKALVKALDDCHSEEGWQGRYVIVCHRRNRDKIDWKVSMCLTDFVELFKAYIELARG